MVGRSRVSWVYVRVLVLVPLAVACSLDRQGLASPSDGDSGGSVRDAAPDRGGPTADAGRDASGPMDSGASDSGTSDSGASEDAGEPGDAGTPDAGPRDAGRYETHVRECESGTLRGEMIREDDGAVSGGQYVHVPADGSEWNDDGSSLPPSRVELSFVLGRDGPWYLWVRYHTTDGSHDAWYAGFAADDLRRYWHLDFETWQWVDGKPSDSSVFRFDGLSAGSHTLSLGPGEPGPRCDAVVVTTNPSFDPTTVF